MKLNAIVTSCCSCNVNKICSIHYLERSKRNSLEKFIEHEPLIKKKKTIIKNGQKSGAIYFVRSGSLKSCITTIDGEEKIINFFQSGDVIGLETIHNSNFSYSIKTLEASSMCKLSFESIFSIQHQEPRFYMLLMELMTRQLNQSRMLNNLLRRNSSGCRFAGYLLYLSDCFKQQGLSPTEFYLSMRREDIAGYLNMTKETISRVIHHLNALGLVEVKRNYVTLKNIEELKKLAKFERNAFRRWKLNSK